MGVPHAIELSGTTEELYYPLSNHGVTYRDYPTMSFEDYTRIRREKGSRVEEDEFGWRWSMSQFRSQMAKRLTEIPQDDQILDSILKNRNISNVLIERTLYITNRTGPTTSSQLSDFMLDLYGDDPELLAAMWTWAKSSNSLARLNLSQHPSVVGDLRVRNFLDRLRSDFSHSRGVRPQTSYGRFAAGLKHFLVRMYKETLDRLVKERISALNLNHETNVLDLLQTAQPWKQGEIPDIIFSVAGSGKTQHLLNLLTTFHGHYLVSGRVIRDKEFTQTLLQARQGLASSDTRHLCDVLDQMDPTNHSIRWYSGQLNSHTTMSRQAWLCLLENRDKTYSRFMRLCPLEWEALYKPQDWLLFQTVCVDGFDPFLETFKILLLTGNWTESLVYDVDKSHPPICFDEAQCELSDGLRRESSWSFSGFSHLMYRPPETVLCGSPRDKEQTGADFQLVIAGTSLQLQRMETLVKDGKNVKDIDPLGRITLNAPRNKDNTSGLSTRDHKSFVWRKTAAVPRDQAFTDLFKGHARRIILKMDYLARIDATTSRYGLWEVYALASSTTSKKAFYSKVKLLLINVGHERLLQRVVDFFVESNNSSIGETETQVPEFLLATSELFAGRIRWSTFFIECILLQYFAAVDEAADDSGQVNAKHLIKNAAQIAEREIISQLQARLEELEKKGHHLLLRDLYLTAVRADLMNRPCTLMDKESAQMITEGFAILKTSAAGSEEDGLRQELSEPLTIRAIIDYLRKAETAVNRQSKHVRVLEQLLFDVQDSHTAFGEVTEYYLGWSFGGLLSQSTLSTERSNAFRELLSKARMVTRYSAPASNNDFVIGALNNYYLLEAQTPRKETGLEVTLEFDDWLQRIRTNKYFPAIYFPPHSAGPDIIFMLRHRTNAEDRILCALQAKTALSLYANSYDVLRTLDPNLWFSTNVKKRPVFLNELYQHANLKIIAGLVTPSASAAGFLVLPEVLAKGLQNLREWVQRYNVLTKTDKASKKDPNYKQHGATMLKWVKHAKLDFADAQEQFKSKNEEDLRQLALRYLGSTDRPIRAEGARMVVEHLSRWLRVKPDKMKSHGAGMETGTGTGYDFFITTVDQTDLPKILGGNAAQLSKAMKLVESSKEKKKERN